MTSELFLSSLHYELKNKLGFSVGLDKYKDFLLCIENGVFEYSNYEEFLSFCKYLFLEDQSKEEVLYRVINELIGDTIRIEEEPEDSIDLSDHSTKDEKSNTEEGSGVENKSIGEISDNENAATEGEHKQNVNRGHNNDRHIYFTSLFSIVLNLPFGEKYICLSLL